MIFHSLNDDIGQEDGEEDGEEVGDVLEWSQDLSHVSGLQYALNHCERHLCNKMSGYNRAKHEEEIHHFTFILEILHIITILSNK